MGGTNEGIASDADPLAGTAYRTIAILGSGGMGEVVEAEHLPLGRTVVVKLLHQQLADDAPIADRLRVEARSLALVQHPNVVAVSDFGRTRTGRPFLVTERLQGRTLGAELRARGFLPVAEAIDITVQVLAGLEAAHQQGIVHRDIKPENIFLCDATPASPRIAKVLDFGLAKIIGDRSLQRTAPEYATKKGTFLGTPRFTAPEQMGVGVVDGRTDIYGTALVLYTLLVGKGPFAHLRKSLELMKAHLHDLPVPPSAHARQSIPPELDAAILKALSKSPGDRFRSAADFAAELNRIAAGASTAPIAPAAMAGANEDNDPPTLLMALPQRPKQPMSSDPEGMPPIQALEGSQGAGLSMRTLVLVTLGTAIAVLGLIMLAVRHAR